MNVSDQWIGITLTKQVDQARFLALMESCWALVTAAGLAPVATISLHLQSDATMTNDADGTNITQTLEPGIFIQDQ